MYPGRAGYCVTSTSVTPKRVGLPGRSDPKSRVHMDNHGNPQKLRASPCLVFYMLQQPSRGPDLWGSRWLPSALVKGAGAGWDLR